MATDLRGKVQLTQAGCNGFLQQYPDGHKCLILDDRNLGRIEEQLYVANDLFLKINGKQFILPGHLTIRWAQDALT